MWWNMILLTLSFLTGSQSSSQWPRRLVLLPSNSIVITEDDCAIYYYFAIYIIIYLWQNLAPQIHDNFIYNFNMILLTLSFLTGSPSSTLIYT